jgi:hypothetical protein
MIVFATNHDSSTALSFSIAQAIIEENDVVLLKNDAKKANLEELLSKYPKLSLIGISHGEKDFWVGNDDKPALTLYPKELLQQRSIFAYACNTAIDLGEQLGKENGCFYWGYNNKILVGELELQPILIPILLYIKKHFHILSDKALIIAFLDELRKLCDDTTEDYTVLWVMEDKFSSIMQLTQALRDIWAKLVVSFDNQTLSHPDSIEPALW